MYIYMCIGYTCITSKAYTMEILIQEVTDDNRDTGYPLPEVAR